MTNTIPIIYSTILYIEMSMYKQAPSAYAIIPTHEGYTYLFNCYLDSPTCQCKPIVLRNGKYYPMLSSPQIWIGITSVLNFNYAEYAEYAEYEEWLEQFCIQVCGSCATHPQKLFPPWSPIFTGVCTRQSHIQPPNHRPVWIIVLLMRRPPSGPPAQGHGPSIYQYYSVL